jgi:hypothetical protein
MKTKNSIIEDSRKNKFALVAKTRERTLIKMSRSNVLML